MTLFNFFSRPSYLEKRIGYTFKNKSLLEQALTHKSYSKEKFLKKDNERLEFLGDSILGAILSDLLMKKYPDYDEGMLSQIRSSLVSTKGLHRIATKVGIGKDLKLGAVERGNDGTRNPRLLASAFEAVVGAIYLDQNYKKLYSVISSIFSEEINSEWVNEDYKTLLQKEVQRKYQQTPIYETIKEHGAPHKKTFLIKVTANNKELGRGKGNSKKTAEQAAAFKALQNISNRDTKSK